MRASASRITVQSAPVTSASTSAAVSSVFPMPGPIRRPAYPLSSSSRRRPAFFAEMPPSESGRQERRMHSGRRGCTEKKTGSTLARVTIPQPPRSAPSAVSAAAPRYRELPATHSSLPYVPLWLSCIRKGMRCHTSFSVISLISKCPVIFSHASRFRSVPPGR